MRLDPPEDNPGLDYADLDSPADDLWSILTGGAKSDYRADLAGFPPQSRSVVLVLDGDAGRVGSS
jgi:hypothetical protein